MNPNGSLATARPGRLLDRVAGVSVVLGLLLAAMPATGLAGRLTPKDAGRNAMALLDPAQLGEALGRGELPFELLAAGSLVTLAAGVALTLLVGTLRRRRRSAQDPDPGPAESSNGGLETRITLPWPVEDVDAFPPTVSPSVSAQAPDEDEPTPIRPAAPSLSLDAPGAEAWAVREATIEVARDTSGWPADPPRWPPNAAPDHGREHETAATPQPVHNEAVAEATETPDPGPLDTAVDSTSRTGDAPPEWQRTALPVPVTAVASIQSVLAPQLDNSSARSILGTPEAPLVVELHDGRADRASRRAGPNLPLVAVIATVAVGVAFSAGAAVGAALGVGAGAAIGLAFAAGAGVAIGATVALLGSRR